MAVRRTPAQTAASKRNLEIARRKRKRGKSRANNLADKKMNREDTDMIGRWKEKKRRGAVGTIAWRNKQEGTTPKKRAAAKKVAAKQKAVAKAKRRKLYKKR